MKQKNGLFIAGCIVTIVTGSIGIFSLLVGGIAISLFTVDIATIFIWPVIFIGLIFESVVIGINATALKRGPSGFGLAAGILGLFTSLLGGILTIIGNSNTIATPNDQQQ